MGQTQRAPLVTVRDLVTAGQPLAFHVYDALGADCWQQAR